MADTVRCKYAYRMVLHEEYQPMQALLRAPNRDKGESISTGIEIRLGFEIQGAHIQHCLIL